MHISDDNITLNEMAKANSGRVYTGKAYFVRYRTVFPVAFNLRLWRRDRKLKSSSYLLLYRNPGKKHVLFPTE